ncbi:ribosomal protein S5 domain 2-type protein [Mycena filopes]|nr:ribosomal protein S5 domain 2-type protein [Mycena filopes]
MHFKLLAYTLLSALCIEAAPTHRGHKRALDPALYNTFLQRGTTILQAIEASSADTPGLTARYNALYAPFTKDSIIGSGTSQFAEIQEVIAAPAISKLVQLSVTRSGTNRQPAYTNYFDVANGIIVGANNFNAKFFFMEGQDGTSDSDPVRTAANSLPWNALVGEQYKALGGNLGQLQHILRYQILNEETLEIMQAAVDMQTLPPMGGQPSCLSHSSFPGVFGSLVTRPQCAEAEVMVRCCTRGDVLLLIETRFGKKPTCIARASGRVESQTVEGSGEHIDYALFGVLPTAVERDILIACAPHAVLSSPQPAEEPHAPVSVIVEPQVYPASLRHRAQVQARRGASRGHLEIQQELRWDNYVQAGYCGVLEEHFTGAMEYPIPVDLLVTGSVPATSGLSSSAAMVVASTLAFLAVIGKLEGAEKVEKGTLVKMSMENEKRVGVNSGGMNQAASILFVSALVLHILFPVLTAPTLPCTSSSSSSSQSPSSRRRRPRLCTLPRRRRQNPHRRAKLRPPRRRDARRRLRHRTLPRPLRRRAREKKITLHKVVGRLVGNDDAKGMDATALMAALRCVKSARDALTPANCTEPEFGATLAEMVELSGLKAGAFHEGQLCLDAAGASAADNETVLKQMGALMNDSQTSSAADFECSCEELDLLT